MGGGGGSRDSARGGWFTGNQWGGRSDTRIWGQGGGLIQECTSPPPPKEKACGLPTVPGRRRLGRMPSLICRGVDRPTPPSGGGRLCQSINAGGAPLAERRDVFTLRDVFWDADQGEWAYQTNFNVLRYLISMLSFVCHSIEPGTNFHILKKIGDRATVIAGSGIFSHVGFLLAFIRICGRSKILKQ